MWAAVDNCYGIFTITKGFKTKREALTHVKRNSFDATVKRVGAGEYEVELSDYSTGFVCKEEKLQLNGYTK